MSGQTGQKRTLSAMSAGRTDRTHPYRVSCLSGMSHVEHFLRDWTPMIDDKGQTT